MKKITSLLLAFALLLSLPFGTFAADKATVDTAIDKVAAYIYQTVKSPQVDSVGGEWAVIGLARSGYNVPDSWF